MKSLQLLDITLAKRPFSLPKIEIAWRTIAEAVALTLLFGIGLYAIQFATPGLAGNDGYYHVKMGYLMRTQGLTPDFPFLPFTILNEAAYYDHHLLYHLFLGLFTAVDPSVDGGAAMTLAAKWASITMPTAAFLAVWWLLRQQQVPLAGLWAMSLLLVSEPFLYRMSMPRAQSMSLLLLALGMHWLLNGRYHRLLPLGFIYVWAYNAFPLLLVLAGIYAIATVMLDRRIPWPALIYPAIGIGLGLIINPYFPQNIDFILGHLAPKLGESATKVGNEWTPYRTQTLLENSTGALMLFLGGVLALGWQEKRLNKRTLMALGTAVLFGFMLFESRRFVEYFPPFALIFAAFATAPHLHEGLVRLAQKRLYLTPWVPLLFGLLLLFPIIHVIGQTQDLMANSKEADRYAEAALWLRDHAEPGAQIFQTDWDDFTRLFFYNSEAVYTAGLDPTFMELHDAELFATWVDITRGQIEQPSQLISQQFHADYVFSDLNHEAFLAAAAADPGLVELYRTDDAVVFAVGEE